MPFDSKIFNTDHRSEATIKKKKCKKLHNRYLLRKNLKDIYRFLFILCEQDLENDPWSAPLFFIMALK